MKHHDTPPLDDDAIARLIETAGSRPPIPAEDLDAIRAAARAAWLAKTAGAETTAQTETGGREAWPDGTTAGTAPARRYRPLALAAALLALAFGLALAARWASRPQGMRPSAVATVAGATGPLRLELGGTSRQLAVGDAVPSGAWVHTGASGGDREPGETLLARAALRMDNGAIVRLDAETAVRLAAADRIELRTGALYADSGRPGGDASGSAGTRGAIEVSTDLGTARDIGTRFMVRRATAREGLALDVLVREGAVALEHEGESAVAAAGEQLVVVAGGPVERRAISTHGPEWAWVMDAAPPFALEGRTFADILEWVSRETGWTVRYEDAALAEAARGIVLEGGGGATRDLRPDQAPFVLLQTARLEGTLTDGVLTVSRSR